MPNMQHRFSSKVGARCCKPVPDSVQASKQTLDFHKVHLATISVALKVYAKSLQVYHSIILLLQIKTSG